MKKIIISIALLLIAFIGFSVVSLINISKYLKEYGYDNSKLLDTYCVYLGLEKGFTVELNDGYTTFIGTDDTEVYEKALKKKGYNQVEQMGTDYFFENDKKEKIVIGATDKWCHWFRVFILDGKYKIEDF